MGFPTPEQSGKFKIPRAHTYLIKVEFAPPPPSEGAVNPCQKYFVPQ